MWSQQPSPQDTETSGCTCTHTPAHTQRHKQAGSWHTQACAHRFSKCMSLREQRPTHREERWESSLPDADTHKRAHTNMQSHIPPHTHTRATPPMHTVAQAFVCANLGKGQVHPLWCLAGWKAPTWVGAALGKAKDLQRPPGETEGVPSPAFLSAPRTT